LIEGVRGIFTPDDVDQALEPSGSLHNAPASLLCIENTHNRGGRSVWPVETFREVSEAARRRRLGVLLDGEEKVPGEGESYLREDE